MPRLERHLKNVKIKHSILSYISPHILSWPNYVSYEGHTILLMVFLLNCLICAELYFSLFESESDVTLLVLCILPIQSAHTQQWTHTHCIHTPGAVGTGQPFMPGEQLGVRCLAQGHFSRGIEGVESAGHSLTIRPRLPRRWCWNIFVKVKFNSN